jgi:osmotically-inducible protein OsmY
VDQGESESDRRITAEIRRAVMDTDGLSINAKNCKIITNNGVVVLRGPVATQAERQTIEAKARAVAGVMSVTNELEVQRG